MLHNVEICWSAQDNHDSQFPQHYTNLLDLLEKLDIQSDVKILGHIPKLDQISLLKKSISLIQPTLFEGGPGVSFMMLSR